MNKVISAGIIYKTFENDIDPALNKKIKEYDVIISEKTKKERGIITVEKAYKEIKGSISDDWFPVRLGISGRANDFKTSEVENCLISGEQIAEMMSQLKPGDILLVRRKWYLTNIGLPGYWTHAAIYIGTPEERKDYFKDDEVKNWFIEQGVKDGNIESLFINEYYEVYKSSVKAFNDGKVPRLIEATDKGVVFSAIENFAKSDSFAVLRPRLNKKEKAIALLRAFKYIGQPYDFNYDFNTDNELVCSELISRSFKPMKDHEGINFPMIEIAGKEILPPNRIACLFDNECGTKDQQLNMVLFYDGYDRSKNAIKSDMESFRKSWKRPKWIMLSPIKQWE